MYFCPVHCCDLLRINIQITSPVYYTLPGRQLASQDIIYLSNRHSASISYLSIRCFACRDISYLNIQLEEYLQPSIDTFKAGVNIGSEHLQVCVQGLPCNHASLSKRGLTCSSLLQESPLHTSIEDCKRCTVSCTACTEHASELNAVRQKNASLHCLVRLIVITSLLPSNVSTQFELKELVGGDICLFLLSDVCLKPRFVQFKKTKTSVGERIRGTKTTALIVFCLLTWINHNSNGVIYIMNNERKDDGTVNQESNTDDENSSEKPVDITKDSEDNNPPVSVNSGTGGWSGTVNKVMVTADSSSTSGIAPASVNTQTQDPFTSTNSVAHVPGSYQFIQDTAQAGSSGRPRYGSDNYSSLKLLGISRRKKFFAPTDSYFSIENDDLKPSDSQSASIASDEYPNNEAMTLDPPPTSQFGVDFAAGKGYFNTSSISSNDQVIDESKQQTTDDWDISSYAHQISEYRNVGQDKRLRGFKEKSTKSTGSSDNSVNSTFLTSVKKQVQGLDNVKSYSSEITTPVEIDGEYSHDILKEVLRKIIDEKESLKHTRPQHSCPGSSENTSESSSTENSTLDSHLNARDTSGCDRQGESSHTCHFLSNFNHDGETTENDESKHVAWELTSPTNVGKFSSKFNSKRSVHFADSVGLGLSTTRLVANSESPPIIPKSVLDALMLYMDDEARDVSETFLSPFFDQPGADFNFLKKVLNQKVCLESSLISGMTVTGFVRVAKVSPYQTVLVRYSVDDWVSFDEINAAHMSATPDGLTERFSFVLEASPNMEPGSFIELVVLMVSNNTEYVDCNDGDNYRFQCVHKLPAPEDN